MLIQVMIDNLLTQFENMGTATYSFTIFSCFYFWNTANLPFPQQRQWLYPCWNFNISCLDYFTGFLLFCLYYLLKITLCIAAKIIFLKLNWTLYRPCVFVFIFLLSIILCVCCHVWLSIIMLCSGTSPHYGLWQKPSVDMGKESTRGPLHAPFLDFDSRALGPRWREWKMCSMAPAMAATSSFWWQPRQSCQPQYPASAKASGTGYHFSSYNHRILPGLLVVWLGLFLWLQSPCPCFLTQPAFPTFLAIVWAAWFLFPHLLLNLPQPESVLWFTAVNPDWDTLTWLQDKA